MEKNFINKNNNNKARNVEKSTFSSLIIPYYRLVLHVSNP